MLGEGGRGVVKVRSENSQPDFRTSEIDIRFRLFKLKIDFLKRLLSSQIDFGFLSLTFRFADRLLILCF